MHIAHQEFPPQRYLAGDEDGQVAAWLRDLPHPRVALNVGAARAYKRWAPENWTAVADTLRASGISLVFVGAENDAETVARIRARLRSEERVVDLSGRTTLRQLGAVLAACDLVVSGDSGPMHLAVAVGTPVVALFGATDPRRHGPYGSRNTVLHDPVPGLTPGRRPTDAQGRASMAALTPGAVMSAVTEQLPMPQK